VSLCALGAPPRAVEKAVPGRARALVAGHAPTERVAARLVSGHNRLGGEAAPREGVWRPGAPGYPREHALGRRLFDGSVTDYPGCCG
jgi:hypothetical protein